MLHVPDNQIQSRPTIGLMNDGQGSPLRVLVVHRYYDPDTPPIASLLRTISERWTANGHDVSVFTGQPGGKSGIEIPRQPGRETKAGVRVQRCWLPMATSKNSFIRIVNFLLFYFFAFCKIVFRWQKYDVVMGLTFPPVVSGAVLGTASALRGSSFIYYLLDIHPESSTFAGKLKPHGRVARVAKWLDRRTCKLAERVVVLSDDMANTYLDRFPIAHREEHRQKMHVIPDFSPRGFDDSDAALPAAFIKPAAKFRIVFAGNIGEFQAIDNLIDTAHLLSEYKDIEFLFVGDGSVKSKAIKQAGCLNGSTVHFHSYQPVETANKIMQTADLCVVSLSPELYRVAFPCKTSSYLAMGCPILVVLEEESELFRMTVDNNLGFACRGQDPQKLKDTILEAYQNQEKLRSLKAPAKAFAERHLVPNAVLVKWEQLIQELVLPLDAAVRQDQSISASGNQRR